MSQICYLANDRYYAELTQEYTPGDTSLYVDIVPDNVPTILVAGKGTTNETVFTCTNKTANAVTGVARLKGSTVELLAQTPITCLNNEEFINQYRSYLGMAWKGEYDAGTDYAIQDAVNYLGSSYIAIADTTGNLPTDTDYWQLVTSKGDTGSQGIQGEVGETGLTGDTGASIVSGAFIADDLVFTKDDTNTVTITDAKVDLKGDQGIQGNQGIPGNDGVDGLGVPAGGATGEVLKKKSNADNDTEWGVGGLTQAQIVNLIYPVGSLYISVTSTNPGTLFGGTWSAWGTGRVPVGIDTNDTDFNTVEKTGGSKSPALLSHNHTYSATTGNEINLVPPITGHGDGTLDTGEAWINISNNALTWTTGRRRMAGGTFAHQHNFSGTTANGSSGDQTNGNLQPYITCYMWKRTA